MLMNLQQGPLMIRRRGGGAEPAFWVRVVRVAMNTAAGSQDLTDPTLSWTPKAVRAIHIGNTADGATSGSTAVRGAVGAYDGTSQWAVSWTNKIDIVEGQAEAGIMARAFAAGPDRTVTATALIPGGVRVTHANESNASFITLELYGGTAMQALAGATNLATINNAVTITPNFQTNILFTAHNGSNFASQGNADNHLGVATYNGTLKQCSRASRITNPGGTRTIEGKVRNDRVTTWSHVDASVEMGTPTSTNFTLTTRGGFDLSGVKMGYLAIGLGGAASAYCDVYDSPTSSGSKDYGGASSTPSFATIDTTRVTALNTQQSNGEGGSFSISSITAAAQYCNHWRSTDAGGSGGTVDDFAEASSVAINTSDHRSLNDQDASFSGFSSTKMTLNETAVTATATKRIVLLVG